MPTFCTRLPVIECRRVLALQEALGKGPLPLFGHLGQCQLPGYVLMHGS